MGRKLKGKSNGKGAKGGLRGQLIAQLDSTKTLGKKQGDKRQGEKKADKKDKEVPKKVSTFIPFDGDDKVLFVGEGDFTFTKSVIDEGYLDLENVITTSYDSLDDLHVKYRDNIDEILKSLNCHVKHEIDGTNLMKSLGMKEEKKRVKSLAIKDDNRLLKPLHNLVIDTIVFNFPHLGSGMKDVDRNIRQHQQLMVGFFESCSLFFDALTLHKHLERPNRIIVSLFEGEPYDSWGVKKIAKNFGYQVERSGNFNWEAFKGYHHRRTNGTLKDTSTPAVQRKARIYVFIKPKVE